ncbi:hypothetical protein [Oligella urethralis]|uniref:hypothetical protein n=1 Tax=Oligella urethralis TaxID=90245 RepID=UPI0029588976|nr:hypothetical protein [Oligella urethralis]
MSDLSRLTGQHNCRHAGQVNCRSIDDIIYYKLPTEIERVSVFKNKLALFVDESFPWQALMVITEGLNNSDIVKISEDSIKEMLLEEKTSITFDMVSKAIENRLFINKHLHKSIRN